MYSERMTKYYLSSGIYDKLSDGEEKSIEIFQDYNDNGKIERYNSERVKRLERDKVEIEGVTYELQHKNVDAERIGHKAPHPAAKREWDESAATIKRFIEEQNAILEKYVSEDLKGIRSNLFVDAGYADVVETKINELRKTLEGLSLRVDILKDRYEHVKDSTPDTEEVREKTQVATPT